MAEAEHVICRAGSVSVVFGDAQVGLVREVMQPVENIWRFTRCRGYHPRVEWPVSAGHMGVDDSTGIDSILGVDRAAGSGATAG